jgi:UDP-glucose 4-epimerase
MTEKVLVTGGAGGVARYVVDELRENYQVTLFDRLLPGQARVPWETDQPFVVGDITDFGDCMRAITLSEADAIIHLGAITYNSERQPGRRNRRNLQMLPEDETMRVNVMGTYYLLDAARRLGVDKIAMASTFFTLGLGFRISDKPFDVEYLPMDEDHPSRPEDTYSLSKVLNEEMLQAFNRAYDIQAVALRLMGVRYPHGPQIQAPQFPQYDPDRLHGDFNTFQYVDARDVAQACRLALEAKNLGGFEAFFISTDTYLGEETRLVVDRVYPHLSDKSDAIKGYDGMISIDKARRMLGYQPRYSWRDDASVGDAG